MLVDHCSTLVKGSPQKWNTRVNHKCVFTILFYFYTNVYLISIHSEFVAGSFWGHFELSIKNTLIFCTFHKEILLPPLFLCYQPSLDLMLVLQYDKALWYAFTVTVCFPFKLIIELPDTDNLLLKEILDFIKFEWLCCVTGRTLTVSHIF